MAIPSLEVHVPISPTERFFNMLRYLVESLSHNGGAQGPVKFVVTVSPEEPERDLTHELPWARCHAIEWRWVDDKTFRRHSYAATGTLARLRHCFEADLVLMLDCDVFVGGPIDEILRDAFENHRLLGLIAHISPFSVAPVQPNEATWAKLFAAAGLPPPALSCQHSLWPRLSGDPSLLGDPEYRHCPPYFNFGVLLAPRDIMTTIGSSIADDLSAVDSVMSSWFRGQIALTLALTRHRIPWKELDLKYNFPFTKPPEALGTVAPNQLEDIRIWHYIDDSAISKYRDFDSAEAIARMLHRADLGPILTPFQTRLRALHQRVVGPVDVVP
jgi:hypothetical protein